MSNHQTLYSMLFRMLPGHHLKLPFMPLVTCFMHWVINVRSVGLNMGKLWVWILVPTLMSSVTLDTLCNLRSLNTLLLFSRSVIDSSRPMDCSTSGLPGSSWITALLWPRGLRNSMKLWARLCRAAQDRWVVMKSSGQMWSTRGGNNNSLQYSYCENPMNSIKGIKRALIYLYKIDAIIPVFLLS